MLSNRSSSSGAGGQARFRGLIAWFHRRVHTLPVGAICQDVRASGPAYENENTRPPGALTGHGKAVRNRQGASAPNVVRHHRFSNEIKGKLKTLCHYDNYHGWLAVVESWGLMAAAAATAARLPALTPLAVLLIGSRQRALATILHEASHRTLFDPCSRWGRAQNLIAGTLFSGYPIFQMYGPYVRSHVREHHPHLGDESRDPDIQYYVQQGLMTRAGRDRFLWRHFLPTLLGLKTPQYAWFLLKNRLLPRDFARRSPAEKGEYALFAAFWTVLLWAIGHFGLWYYFLVFWVLPYLYPFQVIGWIIEVCEHYPLTQDHDEDLYMSRNRLGNRLENFFFGMHSENFHLLHHLNPAVPFWRMRQAHRILMEDPAYAEVTALSGGIFSRGEHGGSPILRALFRGRHPTYPSPPKGSST